MKCTASEVMPVMSKRLADEPHHAASQWHYPMDQQWSIGNALVKIHIRHRDPA